MEGRKKKTAVRPLTEPGRYREPPRVPLLITIALLAIGGTAGFLFGLPGDSAVTEVSTTSINGAAPGSAATPLPYQWLEQEPLEGQQDAWAVHAATELVDDIYLLVSDDHESPTSRALWRSRDGEQWELIPLDLGSDAHVTDLDIYDQSLLLSGWIGTTPTIWRSQPLPLDESPRWTATSLVSDLDAIGRPVTEFSTVSTVVSPSGQTVTVAETQLNLEDRLLNLTSDPDVTSLLHFEGLPEVAVSATRLWMRAVNPGGAELVGTSRIPTTVRVRPVAGHYGTDIAALHAWAMWESPDAARFTPTILPVELIHPLQPLPFGGGLAATTINRLGGTDLWAEGETGWAPTLWTPPAACGDWAGTAADGSRLLTIADNFDTVCTSEDGTHWEVRSSPSTAVSSQATVWIEGAKGGFIATASNSLERAVLTSPDGLQWRRVSATPDILRTRTFLVGDRLVATARPAIESAIPRPMVVWVGEVTAG